MNLAIGSIIDDVYDVFYTYSIKSSTTRRRVIGQKVCVTNPNKLENL